MSVSNDGTVIISCILSLAPPISTSLKSVPVAITEGALSPTFICVPAKFTIVPLKVVVCMEYP